MTGYLYLVIMAPFAGLTQIYATILPVHGPSKDNQRKARAREFHHAAPKLVFSNVIILIAVRSRLVDRWKCP